MSSVIKNKDLLALQAYVKAKDDVQYDDLPASMVLLDLTHSNLKQQHVEIRFYLHDTLQELRSRIHKKTGTSPSFQHLQVIQRGGTTCHPLVEIPPEYPDETKLGYFSLVHGMRIHCIDLDPYSGSKGGQYEDTSLVEKYRMSDEDYHQRKGTLKDWERTQKEKDPSFTLRKHAKEHRELMEARRQGKLGLELPNGFEYDENGQVSRIEIEIIPPPKSSGEKEAATTTSGEHGAETVKDIEVGMRCQAQPGGRRGTVEFVGIVAEMGGGGHWVGIVFDEPVGKTDGTTPFGKRYFTAPGNNYGGFVRGKNLEVGDFPERDIFDEDDSEDEL